MLEWLLRLLTVFLKEGNLFAEGVCQEVGDGSGSVDIVVGIILLALRLTGFFARQEPHVDPYSSSGDTP